MKTILVAGMLVVGSNLQAFSMGQPHNVFAVRKHMRTKSSVSIAERKSDAVICWQSVVKTTKTIFSNLVTVAFSHISPVQPF